MLQLEAAQSLLVEAITAGILGDLGSGGSVDACVITGTGAKMLRTLSSPTKPLEKWVQGTRAFAGADGGSGRMGSLWGPCAETGPPPCRVSHYQFAPGTTAILTQTVQPLDLELLEETVQTMEVE